MNKQVIFIMKNAAFYVAVYGGEIVDTTLQAGDYILDNNLYHKVASLK